MPDAQYAVQVRNQLRHPMAETIEVVPVVVTGTLRIERTISMARGIAWSEGDEHLMLRRGEKTRPVRPLNDSP